MVRPCSTKTRRRGWHRLQQAARGKKIFGPREFESTGSWLICCLKTSQQMLVSLGQVSSNRMSQAHRLAVFALAKDCHWPSRLFIIVGTSCCNPC
jgi:hypothetical protein